MWMSGFDASSNLDSALWPNAAAVAEQVRSDKERSDERQLERSNNYYYILTSLSLASLIAALVDLSGR